MVHDGQVMHEVPELYEADGITLNESAAGNKSALRVIVFLPMTGSIGPLMAQSMPMLKPLLRSINTQSDLLPHHVLELHLLDDACLSKRATAAFLKLVMQHPLGYFHAVNGPGCSLVAQAENEVLQPFRLWQVSPIAVQPPLSNRISYPNFCRLMEPAQWSAEAVRQTLQVFGWSRLAMLEDWRSSSNQYLYASMDNARRLFVSSNGTAGYNFDMAFTRLHRYVVDQLRQVSSEASVARLLAQEEVRVLAISAAMDVGANLFCELFKIGYYGKRLQAVVSPVTWSNTWIDDGIASLSSQGLSASCTVRQIFEAGQGLFLFNQLAYIESSARHGVTGEVLQEVRNRYFKDCSVLSEGCQPTYTSAGYDALALTAQVFHNWLEEGGHSLREIVGAAGQLHSIAKLTRFLGATGAVQFRNGVVLNEDCDRIGTYMVAHYESLSRTAGDGRGWKTLVSFTAADGYGSLSAWVPIQWQDNTTTFMGSGSGAPSTRVGAVSAFGHDAWGLENVPADWDVCGDGFSFTVHGLCEPCPQATSGHGGQCLQCEAGRFSSARGATACSSCAPGFYSNQAGATECAACAVGSEAPERQSTQCAACRAGSYADVPGMSSCSRCTPGSFQASARGTLCRDCSEGVLVGGTTQFFGAAGPSDCQCPPESFWHLPGAGAPPECRPCPEGLSCPGGNGPPLQKTRYWALPAAPGAAPSAVVQCAAEQTCPGGTPLGSCPPHREGVACDLCEVGYTEASGSCAPCGETPSQMPLALAILAACGAIGGLICSVLRSGRINSASVVALTMMCSISLSAVQVLCSFREILVDWPEPIKTFFTFLKVFSFNLGVVRPGCVFKINRPDLTYLGSVLAHPAFALALAAAVAALRALPVRQKFKPSNVQLFNAQGVVVLAVYVGLALVALVPWQCVRNPDRTSSVSAHRSTLCWVTKEHKMMIGLSVVCLLVYVVGVITCVVLVTLQYPGRIQRPGGGAFIKYFNFLFRRFRPERYYYGLGLCLRSLAVALIPVAAVNEPAAAVLLLFFAISLSACLQCALWPWRSEAINFLDAMLSVCLVIVLAGGACVMGTAGAHTITIVQAFYTVIVCAMSTLLVATAVLNMRRLLFPDRPYGVFLSHHKGGAAVLARWFKMRLMERTSDKVFLDVDELDRLDALFRCVAYEVKNFVMLLTKETMQRIWCAGEMATAVRHDVNIVAVACQDWDPPTDAFIDDLADQWTEAQKIEVAILGVELSSIQEAYRQIRCMPTISFDRKAAPGAQEAAIEQVRKKCVGLSATISHAMLLGAQRGNVGSAASMHVAPAIVLVNDSANAEASSISAVLAGLLQAELQRYVVVVTPEEGTLESQVQSATFCVANLTRGALSDDFFARALLHSYWTGGAEVIPVIADSMFQFPDAAEWLRFETGEAGPDLSSESLRGCLRGDILAAYRWAFGTLAVRFSAQGSERIQRVEVQEMCTRFKKPATDALSPDSNRFSIKIGEVRSV